MIATHLTRSSALVALLASFSCSVRTSPPAARFDGGAGAPAESLSDWPNAELVDGAEPENGALRAIARVNSCTGAFIKTSSDSAAPAYVLTAARCLKDPLSSSYLEVINGEPLTNVEATFDLLDAAVGEKPHAAAVQLAYATLSGVDLALVQLASTIGELRARGIEPLALADAAPAAGAAIEMVGLREEHGPDDPAEKVVVRRARCAEGPSRTAVVERYGYWPDLHVNDCTDLGQFATGGPALASDGRVFGFLSTHFGRAKPLDPCYLGSPCEVGHGPEKGVDGANYVVDVTQLASCFDAQGRFTVEAHGCPLDPGGHVLPTGQQWRVISTTSADPAHPNTWGVSFPSEAPASQYRYKVGSMQDADCRSLQGYSNPLRLDDPELANLATPTHAGLYALCLLTGSGEFGSPSWQPIEHPTVIVSQVQGPTPVVPESNDVTTEQAFALAQQIVDAFQAHAAGNGARLQAKLGDVMASHCDVAPDRTWTLQLEIDSRRTGMSADLFSFIACHELGHALGGFPFIDGEKQRLQSVGLAMGQFGSVTSAEGQSDYFAAKECLPRIWASQPERNAQFRKTASEFVKTRCDQAWHDESEQNICYRTAAAALLFGAWTQGQSVPALDQPDPSEVLATDDGHPARQCRVDTIFQAALCKTKFRGTAIPGLIEPFETVYQYSPAEEAAAAPDSCLEGPGARPRCWFAPNGPKARDCMGIPHEGDCYVEAGNNVMKQCDEQQGILTQVCRTTCSISEGFALCD